MDNSCGSLMEDAAIQPGWTDSSMEGFGIIFDVVASITWWSTRGSEQLDVMGASGISAILGQLC
jgi:hypothetical protein